MGSRKKIQDSCIGNRLQRQGGRLLWVILFALVVGTWLEFFVSGSFCLRAGDNRGEYVVTDQAVEVSALPEGEETLVLDLEGAYIHKLSYVYEAETDFTAQVRVFGPNAMGRQTFRDIEDPGSALVHRSVLALNQEVERLEITFDTPGRLTLTQVTVDNAFQFNPFRWLLFTGGAYLLLFLLVFREDCRRRVEWAFLNTALTLGVLVAVLTPNHCMGWDEHIHLAHVYEIAAYGEADMPASVAYLYEREQDFRVTVQTMEERMDEMRTLDLLQEEASDRALNDQAPWRLSSIGYLSQALPMKLGLALSLPFSALWILGRLGNVILYSLLLFLAIRKTPVGKVLLAFTGLLPTAVFLSGVYTYDTTVTACLALALAILVKGLLGGAGNFRTRDQVAFTLLVLLACCPKPVYAPLLLAGLLVPGKNFATKRSRRIFRGLYGAGILAALAGGLYLAGHLPLTGDDRGGITSPFYQLMRMAAHPLTYLRMLGQEILGNLLSYAFIFENGGGYAAYGYAGRTLLPMVTLAGLTAVGLTDTQERDRLAGERKGFFSRERAGLVILVLFAMALTVTSMYLNFTPVGAMAVAGVQARYYLPLLWIFILALQPRGLRVGWDKARYQWAVLSLTGLYLLWNLYALLVQPMAA